MKKATLTVELRKPSQKGVTRSLRRMGKIPAIVYGAHEPLAITIDEREFNQKFKVISENTIITLKLENQQFDVLIKDYQEDIIKNKILHLDLYAIDQNKALRTHVPVYLQGTSIGVKEGGILEHLLHEVEVECLPADLPEKIEIDISNLAIHHSIHIRELPILKGIRYLNPAEQVVCQVVTKAAEVEAPREGAAEAAQAVAEPTSATKAEGSSDAKKKEE